MSASAFGVEHGLIAKAEHSGAMTAGSVAAAAGAVGTHVAAKKSRSVMLARRGSGFLRAFAAKDTDGMARHLSGTVADAKKIVALHGATPVLGTAAVALGAGALASRRKNAPQLPAQPLARP